jgi:hypothetical protein
MRKKMPRRNAIGWTIHAVLALVLIGIGVQCGMLAAAGGWGKALSSIAQAGWSAPVDGFSSLGLSQWWPLALSFALGAVIAFWLNGVAWPGTAAGVDEAAPRALPVAKRESAVLIECKQEDRMREAPQQFGSKLGIWHCPIRITSKTAIADLIVKVAEIEHNPEGTARYVPFELAPATESDEGPVSIQSGGSKKYQLASWTEGTGISKVVLNSRHNGHLALIDSTKFSEFAATAAKLNHGFTIRVVAEEKGRKLAEGVFRFSLSKQRQIVITAVNSAARSTAAT